MSKQTFHISEGLIFEGARLSILSAT